MSQLLRDADITRSVHAHAEGSMRLLEELISRRSCVGEERSAQELVGEELSDLGFDVAWVPIPDSIVLDPLAGVPQHSYDDRSSIVGTTSDGSGPTLLINGHIDVVPVDHATWSSDPFLPVLRDGWMYGRGAGDMKGGFAMVFLALRALRALDSESIRHGLSFLSVIEEECTGNGTLAALRSGIVADAVLLPEPTDLNLLLGGVPITWLLLRLGFGGGHAESSERLLRPIDVIARVSSALGELEAHLNASVRSPFDSIAHPYNINVGRVSMGEWPSSVPGSAELEIRVGHPEAMSSEQVVKAVESAVASVLPESGGPTLGISPSGFRAEGYALPFDVPLVRAMASVHASLHGSSPTRYVLGSTTDARYYVNQAGVPALCYGPVVRNMHGSDECVDIASIVRGACTYAKFISRYVGHCGLDGFEEGSW